ncbi:MAG: hypothetical protein A2516_06800 [Alphaproteobacteria bacterium RIFOXYD12_FULL_60_8]|nr:MAG: hypothetical protein A2516_06800 [Alphaproteobacteria bacterium RIFOXYD12_FULL_60_8]
MGVILKVLHRCESLKKAEFRNMFLDMEENIHIHYRDLRIELSRKEFEDIVRTFSLQSAELMAAIQSRNYQDGILPNANHDELRIWTESRLENDVVYHPQRLSLEECSDGYHIHFRNYKFLLSREDFAVVVQAFREIEIDSPYAATVGTVLELFEANHLHYNVRQNKPAEGRVLVAHYHEPKARAILTGIGMTRQTAGGIQTYTKGDLKIVVETSSDRSDFADRFAGVPRTVRPLTEVLQAKKDKPDLDWLNALKSKVLDTFCHLKESDSPITINMDYNAWLYDDLFEKVVFPYEATPKLKDARAAYRAWSKFLVELDMYFVKPTKVVFPKPKQTELYNSIIKRVNEAAAQVPAISKIHLMGSAAKGSMGMYKAPFIHSEWSKLGSDVDLLIEIDESKPFEAPEGWHYINVSATNDCAIYHIGELPFSDPFGHRRAFPNIKHFNHLLDAYVFFPSKGEAAKKDAFLDRFKAKVVFDRAREDGLRQTLEREFAGPVENVKRLDVATENEIYAVDVAGRAEILKVYKVSGNYNSSKLAEHTAYECALVKAVEGQGVAPASVRETKDGRGVFEIDGAPAVLFERLEGEEVAGPETYPLVETAKALAHFHDVQIKHPLPLSKAFSFDHTFDIWHVEFHRFAKESAQDAELTECFQRLEPTYGRMKDIYKRMTAQKKIAWVHNHGDVQPRNVIVKDGKPTLFDLQNAFYGPRLFDLMDGAVEFSWGFKNPDHDDFSRFNRFVAAYEEATPLSAAEKKALDDALRIIGTIKFIKEVRMIKGDTNKNNLRRRRGLDLARFMLERLKS